MATIIAKPNASKFYKMKISINIVNSFLPFLERNSDAELISIFDCARSRSDGAILTILYLK